MNMKATIRIYKNGTWDTDIPIVLNEQNYEKLAVALAKAELAVTSGTVIHGKSGVTVLPR